MHLRRVGFFVHRAYSELDFLVQRRHFESKGVLLVLPVALLLAQNARKNNSLSLYLSLSVFVRVYSLLFKGALSRRETSVKCFSREK